MLYIIHGEIFVSEYNFIVKIIIIAQRKLIWNFE